MWVAQLPAYKAKNVTTLGYLRVCRDCGCTYRPVTHPAVIGVTLTLGVLLTLGGLAVLGTAALVFFADDGERYQSPCSLFCPVALLAFGIVAVVGAIKAMVERPVEPPAFAPRPKADPRAQGADALSDLADGS